MIVIPATRDEAFETQSDRFCRLWSFDFFVVIVSVDIFAILTRRLNILGDRCHFFLSWTITVDNTHIFGIRSSIINCGESEEKWELILRTMVWNDMHAYTQSQLSTRIILIFRRCASHASNEIFVYSPIFA